MADANKDALKAELEALSDKFASLSPSDQKRLWELHYLVAGLEVPTPAK